MSKVAVVYWSMTGNTEMMAESVVAGAKAAGADTSLIPCAEFSSDSLDNYDAIAFGCPAMGDEVLEEYEFQPMWDDVKSKLGDKKIALFGSYNWNDGEWMRNWEAECEEAGLNQVTKAIICLDDPDSDEQKQLENTGAALS
ncbi:MAG: flavodoxin [Epulopiscium sp.]|nr:flavodoxin [Candidatus Epulonipiscium sp.]